MPTVPPPYAPPESKPLLVGDHAAMHLLNSRATPGGQEVEWIGNGEALVRWLAASGVGPTEALEAAGTSASSLDAVAATAREFREWFRRFVASQAGQDPVRADLEELAPLNDLLCEASVHRKVEAVGDRFSWGLVHRQCGPRVLLQPLASAVGDLVCEADFSRVRQCQGEGCSVWFLDRTKGGKRRWCSMAVCGNRAKATAYRARERKDAAITP